MKPFRPSVCALVLAVLAPITAVAASIVTVSQTYTAYAFADPQFGSFNSNTDTATEPGTVGAGAGGVHPNAPSIVLRASVTQTSLATDSRLYLTVRHINFSTGLSGAALSQATSDVLFDLLEPSNFGYLRLWSTSGGGTFQVTLTDALGAVFPLGPLGVLPAGRYRLLTDSRGSFGTDAFTGDSNGFADLWFTPIPEPGTALLVALGLGALAARRERAPR